jgi:hypothetical protein
MRDEDTGKLFFRPKYKKPFREEQLSYNEL